MKAAIISGPCVAVALYLLLVGGAVAQDAANYASREEPQQKPEAAARSSATSYVPSGAERGNWYFFWENDSLAIGSGSDEFYTQGMRLGYVYPSGKEPHWLAPSLDWTCGKVMQEAADCADPRKTTRAFSFILGQHFFTPGEIHEQVALIPDDRPYAAWLYVGGALDIANKRSVDDIDFHNLELQVGVIGPIAQGEWVQREFHKLIDDRLPVGWDNQLPNEAGIFGLYRFTRLRKFHPGTVDVHVAPYFEMGLGTIQDYVESGGYVRIGRNILSPPFRNLAPRKALIALPDSNYCLSLWGVTIYECSLFARVSGRATAFNAFLDGTLFHGGHSVDREPFTYDLSAGFSLRWKFAALNYELVRRSREFSPVPATASNRDGKHDYGSVNVECLGKYNWACPAFVISVLAAMFAQ